MPRFYFHISDELGDARDEEGQDLDSVDAARDEAVKAAKEYIGSKLANAKEPTKIDIERRLIVTDEAGVVVLTLPFSEVTDRLEHPPAD